MKSARSTATSVNFTSACSFRSTNCSAGCSFRKAPSSNIQAPEKLQIPSSKKTTAPVCAATMPQRVVFEAWNFFGAWCLEFGAFFWMGDRAVYCARLESVCAERHPGFESPPIRHSAYRAKKDEREAIRISG